MSKPDSPCKDCSERFLKCHASCQKYIDFQKELPEWKFAEYNRKKKDLENISYIGDAKRRMSRKRK